MADGSGELGVATTRPETFMGDTGVAVNPNDERYKHLIGKTCILPIMNREIPIVGDEYCEIGFGTGAVKMTPAHDPNDFEVGLRHNLEVIRVIADDGTINENGGKMPDAVGIPEEQLRHAAELCVCKILFDSDLRLAMTAEVRKFIAENPAEFDPRKYLGPGRDAIQAMVQHKIKHVLNASNTL